MRLISRLAVLFLLVPACSGEETELPPSEEKFVAVDVDPAEPCSLLSPRQIETALGTKVRREYEVGSHDLVTRMCSYDTAAPWASVGVSLATEITAADYTKLFRRDPVNTEAVEGIGDKAFIHGCSGISVLVGDILVSVGVQHLTTCEETADVLRDLGIEAVEKLT